MLNIFDVVVILFLLMGAIVGFKRGFFKSFVTFVGAIIVIFVSYSLKNPVSKLLYTFMPFFSFSGDYEGLTVLNIIIYEAASFLIVYIVLMCVLQILIKVTGLFEKVLNFTIILAVPSKFLGAIFGLLETYLFLFIALFLLSGIPSTHSYIVDAKLSSKILNSSPVLSSMIKDYSSSFEEILSIKDENITDKEEYNEESLKILIKYNIVTEDAAKDLVKDGKIKVKHIENFS